MEYDDSSSVLVNHFAAVFADVFKVSNSTDGNL